MKIILELEEDQANAMMTALDTYSRLCCGQLHVLDSVAITDEVPGYDEMQKVLRELKMLLFPKLVVNSFYGIYGRDTHESAKIIWDIYQVIRHRLSWFKAGDPKERDWDKMMGMNYNEPLKASKTKLPKIKIEEDSDGNTNGT
jgi:hypothetical protein